MKIKNVDWENKEVVKITIKMIYNWCKMVINI